MSFLDKILPKKFDSLPKLKASSATELSKMADLSPEAQALITPDQSAAELVQALQDEQQSLDAVNALAMGMPETDATDWACQCSEMVSDKLNMADQAALEAAQDYVKSPSLDTQAAAARAAASCDLTGPGGWAARAAAWAPAEGASAVEAALAPPVGSSARAAAGAVLLAAGLTKLDKMPEVAPPGTELPSADLPELGLSALEKPAAPAVELPAVELPPQADPQAVSDLLEPFIELGKLIASGQSPVG